MIIVDSRVGSAEFAPALKRLGHQVCLDKLEFGDFFFEGFSDKPINIGVERKTLSDLVGCMTSARYVDHQLPGMLRSYQEVHLIVEGIFKEGDSNCILQMNYGKWYPLRSGMTFNQVDKFLWTVRRIARVIVTVASTPDETTRYISNLYHHSQKPFESHSSFHKLHTTDSVMSTLMDRPNKLQRIAAMMPGVGWKRAKEVAKHFDIPLQLAMASVEKLETIDGIGNGTATKIYKFWRERA